MPFDWHRNRDMTFTVKVMIHHVVRVFLPLLSFLSILYGYYLIWSLSPDTHLTEVIAKTRTGIFLTISGGIILLIWMHRILK